MRESMIFILLAITLLTICIDADTDSRNGDSKRIQIPPGGYHIVYYDKEIQELKESEIIEEFHGLPFNVIEAVVRSPQWIRKDLVNNFCELYKIPVEVGKSAKIAFEDVSNDGKKDLIIKCGDGTIRVFVAPYWKEEKLQAKVSSFEDVVYHDITGDGIVDKIGASEEGRIYFQKNFGTNQKPYYLENIKTNKKMFDIQEERSVSPAFGDLNGDKKADLIIGNKEGEIKIYYGPDFKKSDVLPVKVNGYSKPVICDFSKDGVPDLIIGCKDGKIYGFVGPFWKEETNLFKAVKVSSYSAPAICDIDNDGILIYV